MQPLDPENRATSLWDCKKVCVARTFNYLSDAFNCMYQYEININTKGIDAVEAVMRVPSEEVT